MFRFTIRDVLWLTVVAAVVAAWWVDWGREAAICSHAEALKAALLAARDNEMLRDAMTSYSRPVNPRPSGASFLPNGPKVDWELADKPIPP